MLIGYARCSTSGQDHALQIDALAAAGCERIFTETASGSQKDRPELAAALSHLRAGDVLVIWKLDRLARSLSQLLSTAEDLEGRGVGLRSLTEDIRTDTPSGKLVFSLFGALAEFERSLIAERVRAGIEAAKAKGKLGGRPRKFTDTKLKAAKALLEAGSLPVEEVARQVGISAASLYRYFPRARSDAGRWAAPKMERVPPVLVPSD